MNSGVYWIYQISNDRAVYVGSGVNVARRRRHHLSRLKNGKHRNPHLQNVWNKYGMGDFQILRLEECPIEQIIEREQFWMSVLSPVCNIAPATDSPMRGRHHSQETRNILRVANLGKSPSNKGVPLTDEQRRKCSEAHKGLKYPPRTVEARRNISNALKGKKRRPLTEEHKNKLRNAMIGNKHAKKPNVAKVKAI